jgi:hypothetical protein
VPSRAQLPMATGEDGPSGVSGSLDGVDLGSGKGKAHGTGPQRRRRRRSSKELVRTQIAQCKMASSNISTRGDNVLSLDGVDLSSSEGKARHWAAEEEEESSEEEPVRTRIVQRKMASSNVSTCGDNVLHPAGSQKPEAQGVKTSDNGGEMWGHTPEPLPSQTPTAFSGRSSPNLDPESEGRGDLISLGGC